MKEPTIQHGPDKIVLLKTYACPFGGVDSFRLAQFGNGFYVDVVGTGENCGYRVLSGDVFYFAAG